MQRDWARMLLRPLSCLAVYVEYKNKLNQLSVSWRVAHSQRLNFDIELLKQAFLFFSQWFAGRKQSEDALTVNAA